MDTGVGRATVHEVAKSWTQLSDWLKNKWVKCPATSFFLRKMFKLFIQRNVTSGYVTLRKRQAPHSDEKHHILLFEWSTLERLTVFQKGYILDTCIHIHIYIYICICAIVCSFRNEGISKEREKANISLSQKLAGQLRKKGKNSTGNLWEGKMKTILKL